MFGRPARASVEKCFRSLKYEKNQQKDANGRVERVRRCKAKMQKWVQENV